MDKIAEIKKRLKEVVNANPNYPIAGTVTAVDGETCSVKMASGLVLSGVLINATVTDGTDYLLLIPAIGSNVLLLSGDGTLSNLYVIKTDQVAKFDFSQNGLKVAFDSVDKKVSIENESASLKGILEDLAKLLKGLQVFTPVGPSGMPLPTTIAKIEAFETSFKSLLK